MLDKLKKNYYLLIITYLYIYFLFKILKKKKKLNSKKKKKKIYKDLKLKESNLIGKIEDLEQKNSLLTDNLDLDFIEILIREKFLFGKPGETTYIIKKDGKQN